MVEFLTAFMLLIVLTLVGAAYYNNRTRSKSNGGFIFSPIPFVLINYALIYAYRPFVILHFDAPTLNYVEIDNTRAYQAIQLGLLSLGAVLLPYIANFYGRPSRSPPPRSAHNKFHIDRLFWLLVFFSALVIEGIILYGSALNNTGDRFNNPSEYKGFFIFIIVQRFHFVLSVLTFNYFLSTSARHAQRKRLLFFLLMAPLLVLLAAGRGATFYLLIAYSVIYVFARSVRISWKLVGYICIVGMLFSFLNFLLSVIRVVISSPGWVWGDVINAVDLSKSAVQLEDLFILASWDYSVFDVFVTIVNELKEHTFGATNLQYLLSYVPRVFWPEKPLDQGFMLYVTNKFYGDIFRQTGSTFAGTIAGEGYLNFGVIGILIYSYFFSSIFYHIYRKACDRSDSNSIILYALAFPFSQQVIRGGLDVIVNFVVLIIIPLLLVNSVLRKSSRYASENVFQT